MVPRAMNESITEAMQDSNTTQAQMVSPIGRPPVACYNTVHTFNCRQWSPKYSHSIYRELTSGIENILNAAPSINSKGLTKTRFGYSAETSPFIETVIEKANS